MAIAAPPPCILPAHRRRPCILPAHHCRRARCPLPVARPQKDAYGSKLLKAYGAGCLSSYGELEHAMGVGPDGDVARSAAAAAAAPLGGQHH